MATVTTAGLAARRPRFFFYMAAVSTAIAFAGFLPTYWLRIADGSFTGQPVMHLHGALFFAWTLLFLWQTGLVATGRVADHRKWGMAGIFLFGMMMLSVPLASINSMFVADRISPEAGMLARQFSAVPLTGLPVLLGLFGFAIANVHRPNVHKRLMLTLQIPLLQAAFSRWVAVAMTPADAPPGPPPGAFVSLPGGLAMDLLLVVAMLHDRRTTGRVHTAYKIAVPVVVAQQFLVVPVSTSAAWLAFATWLQHLVR